MDISILDSTQVRMFFVDAFGDRIEVSGIFYLGTNDPYLLAGNVELHFSEDNISNWTGSKDGGIVWVR